MGRANDRKHRATGKKPPGGKRDGAGRPAGLANTLGYGEVRAVKVARLRVPDGASQESVELADRAQQRIIDVMEERVGQFNASFVLKAATRLREEICGPLATKVEHAGHDGGPLQVSINIVRTVPEPVGLDKVARAVRGEFDPTKPKHGSLWGLQEGKEEGEE